MSLSSSALLPGSTDAFLPRVIPLEVNGNELAAYSSEASPHPAGSGHADGRIPSGVPVESPPVPDEPLSTPRVVLRLPKGTTAWTMAMVTGAFCGFAVAAIVGPIERPALRVGKLAITSEPPGAIILIDGAPHGVTPLTAVLPVGAHHVAVGENGSARSRLLRVTPGGEASVHVEWPAVPARGLAANAALSAVADVIVRPIDPPDGASTPTAPASRQTPSPTREATPDRVARASAAAAAPVRRPPTGWLRVTSPFPVRVYHDGADVGGSDDGRIKVAAGETSVVLVNEALEFRQAREVTIAANRSVALIVDAPPGVLHANARPWAEVWIDGRRAGDTPIGNLTIPVGEHDIVFKHPRFGEAHRVVSVGARTPARVAVEFQP